MDSPLIRDRFKAFSDGSTHYELWTVNTMFWPTDPTHPRLLNNTSDSFPFPLQPDGSYGYRDWLFTAYPFQKTRAHMHYMPTKSMWKVAPFGFEYVPIFVKPRKQGDQFWYSHGPTGQFSTKFIDELRRFHDIAVQHALGLKTTATHYHRIPQYGNLLPWAGVEGQGNYSQMVVNLVDLQRRVSELYGWIFLQEKLQPDVQSINPRPFPDPAYKGTMPLDYFTGVIVPWNERVVGFDRMALQHGVPLWHCDYVLPESKEHRAPFAGLVRQEPSPELWGGDVYVRAGIDDVTTTYTVLPDTSGKSRTYIDALITPTDPARFKSAQPASRPSSRSHHVSFPSRQVPGSSSSSLHVPEPSTVEPPSRIAFRLDLPRASGSSSGSQHTASLPSSSHVNNNGKRPLHTSGSSGPGPQPPSAPTADGVVKKKRRRKNNPTKSQREARKAEVAKAKADAGLGDEKD